MSTHRQMFELGLVQSGVAAKPAGVVCINDNILRHSHFHTKSY